MYNKIFQQLMFQQPIYYRKLSRVSHRVPKVLTRWTPVGNTTTSFCKPEVPSLFTKYVLKIHTLIQ